MSRKEKEGKRGRRRVKEEERKGGEERGKGRKGVKRNVGRKKKGIVREERVEAKGEAVAL